jgi:Protein of unknown function (DUF3572)
MSRNQLIKLIITLRRLVNHWRTALRLKTSTNAQSGDDITLKYMSYLASDSDKLTAFCSQFGLGIDDLRSRLAEPDFQGFLLDTLLQDESELLAFAADHNMRPETIMLARSKLPGFAQ